MSLSEAYRVGVCTCLRSCVWTCCACVGQMWMLVSSLMVFHHTYWCELSLSFWNGSLPVLLFWAASLLWAYHISASRGLGLQVSSPARPALMWAPGTQTLILEHVQQVLQSLYCSSSPTEYLCMMVTARSSFLFMFSLFYFLSQIFYHILNLPTLCGVCVVCLCIHERVCVCAWWSQRSMSNVFLYNPHLSFWGSSLLAWIFQRLDWLIPSCLCLPSTGTIDACHHFMWVLGDQTQVPMPVRHRLSQLSPHSSHLCLLFNFIKLRFSSTLLVHEPAAACVLFCVILFYTCFSWFVLPEWRTDW